MYVVVVEIQNRHLVGRTNIWTCLSCVCVADACFSSGAAGEGAAGGPGEPGEPATGQTYTLTHTHTHTHTHTQCRDNSRLV